MTAGAEQNRRTVPEPSLAPGWYRAPHGFTSDPTQANQVLVCQVCDEYHQGMDGSCLL